MTWRRRWFCSWRALWVATRLEYWMSCWRCITSYIVSGSVPIEFPIDAHRREGWGKCARGHDVLEIDRHVAAVEVLHLAGAHTGGTDGQARIAAVDEREVDELAERLLELRRRVVAGVVGSEQHMCAPERHRV